ncbi:OLC1v1009997C1 [Oldenlandia corymbosa var. corymbosa]|uniref:OLC1v1009997C1 n=1 Tax=Oldenlandia corymbosa var. corymbosa TaxID=529605 RepID=A0AAV1DQA9_OLDCO|nr:OLC1v1009997C1 [Oldenlandia corymbosa var. corymbosa]
MRRRRSSNRSRDMDYFMRIRPKEAYEFPAPGFLQSKTHCPWLVYRHGEDNLCQTFCNINSSSRGVIFKDIPNLRRQGVVYCSPDGNRILLSKFTPEEQFFFAWSVKEDEVIHLPPLGRRLGAYIIRYGLLSDSSPSLVLLFVEQMPRILYFRIGDRDNTWRVFNYADSIIAQTGYPLKPRYFLCSPVIFNGTIYATASGYTDLVQITIDYDNDHCETRLLMPEDDDERAGFLAKRHCQGLVSRHFVRIFLVNLGDQDLYLILMYPLSINRYRDELSISILQFDFSSNTWQERTSLNGGTVFLCPDYSLSLSTVGGSNSEWSYIYFTFENDQTLFSYRVEDEKVTSYLVCPPNILEGEKWLPYWIMPALPLDDGHELVNNQQQQQENAPDFTGVVTSDMAEFWNKCRRQRSRPTKRRRVMEQQNESAMAANSGNIPSLCDLPQEVLGLIAGNLCYVDYIHFRCLNRVCSSSIVRPMLNSFFRPSLIYKDRSKDVYNIVADSNLSRKLSVKAPTALKDYVIRCTRGGWLLLENSHDLAFLNPLTMQIHKAGHACVREHRSGETQRKSGKAQWRAFGVEKKVIKGSSSPVVLGNLFYYLGDNGMLGCGRFIIDQDGECIPCWEVLNGLVFPRPKFKRNYLTECGGELLSILVGDDDRGKRPWVRVFKLRDHEEWEEMETLGGHCLYLSRLSSISCLAPNPYVANRIYFPKFYKDELVYYSLSTKRYHSAGSQQELQSFNETSRFVDCAWIQPSWT